MISTVVFDVDGVLVVPPFRFMAYLREHHALPPERTAEFFKGPFHDCLLGQADLRTALAPFLEPWGWTAGLEAFIARWFSEEHVLNAPLLATVDRLRAAGLRCWLATNQERLRADYIWTAMGGAAHFAGLIASAHIGAVKPQPAFYAHAQAIIGADPAALLFWDDAAANVVAAREAGWHAEVYTDQDAFETQLQAYQAAGQLPALA